MAKLRSLPLSVLAGVLLCATAVLAQEAAPAVRIVNQIDERNLVTLNGTLHPLANAANDKGAAPDSMQLERMHLVLKRSNSQESALRQLINDMHTPGSASYHQWLTPDQFGTKFGASDQDIATVEEWLTGHGFSVTKVNPGKLTLEFSGNVAQMRSAFHTQIHKYVVNGQAHYANSTNPQIPSALAPVVGGFVSLNNFPMKSHAKQLGKALYDPQTGKTTPQWTVGSNGSYSFPLSPADYAIQYDLNPLYSAGINGTGQTVAIVNESNINIALVNQFRSLFGLSVNPPQVIIDGNDPGIDGVNNPDGENGASVEAYLDVEWAGAVAPAAQVDLVIAADTSLESGLILAGEHAVYGNVAPVISLSFGMCEASLGTENQFLSSLYEQAAAQGITVLVSTGDSGSAGCDDDNTQAYALYGQQVSGYASTPYNVAVGGTDFYYSAYNGTAQALSNQIASYWTETPSNATPITSIKGVIPEQPWNDSQFGLNLNSEYIDFGYTSIAGGSGGASNCAAGSGTSSSGGWATCTAGYAKPVWQTGTGVPSDGVRDIPDVSLFASSGINASYYPICATDGDCSVVSNGYVQIFGVGGTSASTPAFAGMMALVNQKYGRQGQADFVLYPLAAQYPAAFHDVVNGTNSEPCELSPSLSANCIAVTSGTPITYSGILEGEIGKGTTAEYNATTGYDLATGLGTIDAYNMVTDWNLVAFKSTTTTMTPGSTSFAHGTALSITGTVTGTSPTGQVALMTDSTEPINQGETFFPLSGGAYSTASLSAPLNYMPGGTYNIWAHYGGDSSNAASDSAKTQITVTPESSAIDFNIFSGNSYFSSTPPSGSSSSNPGNTVDYGTQLVLSALVTPSSQLSAEEGCVINGTTCPVYQTPTGTVSFTDSGSTINTAAINVEGDAEYNAPFSVGSHSVTVNYSGDKSYNAATAPTAIAFKVVQDVPQIGVSASNQTSSGSIITGQPTVINVQIENNAQVNDGGMPVGILAPTGQVTVSSSPSGISGTVTLSSGIDPNTGAATGVGTLTVPSSLATGTYTVTVKYAGDTNYTAVQGAGSFAVISSGLTPTTTTASTSGAIAPNNILTITGTVTGATGHGAPTGGIIFYTSGYEPGEIAIVPGTGASVTSTFSFSINSSDLAQGANFITLQYSGDTTYAPSAFTLNSGGAVANPQSDFTLVPATTLVPVTAGSSATDTINLGSTNGFSGTVNLTCKATVGVSCTITPTASVSNGGGSATLTVTAPSTTADTTYNVLVTGTDAATGLYVHTLAIAAVVTGSPAGSTSFAVTSSGNINIGTAGATTNNTSTITVSPIGGFTGIVGLTCAVSPTTGTSVPTCSLSATSVNINGSALTSTLTIGTTASTTLGVYTVTVTGASGAISVPTTVTVNVGTPSFTLTAPNGAITIATTGATTGNTGTITVTPVDAFTGTVNLSCTVAAPSGANDPATCNLASSTVTISGSSAQTDVLTINTTAATALNHPVKLFWPSAGGTALALVLLFVPRRRRNWLTMVGLLVLAVSFGALGCGGSGGGGGGGSSSNPGTTTGTYTVTVTGTSGSVTQTTTVTVNVQ